MPGWGAKKTVKKKFLRPSAANFQIQILSYIIFVCEQCVLLLNWRPQAANFFQPFQIKYCNFVPLNLSKNIFTWPHMGWEGGIPFPPPPLCTPQCHWISPCLNQEFLKSYEVMKRFQSIFFQLKSTKKEGITSYFCPFSIKHKQSSSSLISNRSGMAPMPLPNIPMWGTEFFSGFLFFF